ncbi:MAG TPA: hypothetical protein VEY93_16325, partial [Longimicrobium sp.]|nr:hypothetical protein [Longimicrobium sp.]
MSDAREVRGSHAPVGMAAAREALAAWVNEEPAGREFLQVRLLHMGGERYEIRHVRDVRRSLESL